MHTFVALQMVIRMAYDDRRKVAKPGRRQVCERECSFCRVLTLVKNVPHRYCGFCDSMVHDQTQFLMGNPNISNSKDYSERKGTKSQVFSEGCKFFVFSVLLVFWEFLPKNLIEIEKKGDIRNQRSQEYLNMQLSTKN